MKMSKLLLTGAIGLVTLGLAACGGGSRAAAALPAPAKRRVPQARVQPDRPAPAHAAGVELGKRLEEASPRAVTQSSVYPNEQLGGQADVIQNLSNGTVELMWVGGPVLEGLQQGLRRVQPALCVFDLVDAQLAVLSEYEALDPLFTSIEEKQADHRAGRSECRCPQRLQQQARGSHPGSDQRFGRSASSSPIPRCA